MCTVTALPASRLASGSDRLLLRVVCNRDERIARAPALPPTLWRAGARRILMPIDPSSGGTWIAANDAGLVFALLNTYRGRAVRSGEVSRGTIIPTLIGSATLSHAQSLAVRLPALRFSPFRLLMFDRSEVVDCWSHGAHMRHRRQSLRDPWLRTSSSLGDAAVIGPRRTLFQRLLREEADARHAQDRFHRHRWPEREALSVNMRRTDARTVSHTVVEVYERSVTLAYQATEWQQPATVQIAA